MTAFEPANDSFRNHMARKIELQRWKFSSIAPARLHTVTDREEDGPFKRSDNERRSHGRAPRSSTSFGFDGESPQSVFTGVGSRENIASTGEPQAADARRQRHVIVCFFTR